MNNMNILLITDDFFPWKGGISQHLTSLCKMFNKKNHTLFVFNPCYKNKKNIFDVIDKSDYGIKDFFFQKGKFYLLFAYILWNILIDYRTKLSHRIKIILYAIKNPGFFIKITLNLINVLPICKKIKYDLIFAGAADYPLHLSYILSRIFNKKLIVFGHGNDFLFTKSFFPTTYLLRNSDGIINATNVISDYMREIHRISEIKPKIIPHGLILNEYEIKESKKELRGELDILDDEFVILCVGKFVPRKNFDLILKAIKLIKDLIPNIKIKCFLIGFGPETDNLKKLVNELAISNCTEFLGKVGDLTRNKYYKLSDIFIMPSVKLKNSIEGFGIVFLEANYYNLPTIGAYSGGIVEAVEHNKSGLLVKPNDVNDLKDKILYLYKNKEIRERMGAYGHKRVVKKYNWNYIIDEYINYFKEIIIKDI